MVQRRAAAADESGEPPGEGERATTRPEPSLRRFATLLLVVVLAGLFVALFVLAFDIFLAAFGGVLFAVFLRGGAKLLESRTPVPERWAYATFLLLLVALLAGAALLLAPVIQEEIEQASEEIPRIVSEVESTLQEHEWGRWILDRFEDGGGGEGGGGGMIGAVGGVFGALGDWFYYGITSFFVGLFAAARPSLYVEGTAKLLPVRKRPRTREVLHELGYTLRWWLLGQMVVMVIIGVSVGLLLWAFGVPLAIPLGVLVGLLGFIPYLGPIIGLIPVAIVASTVGAETLLYVLAAYTGVQLVEGYVIAPLVQHRMVYLPPAFTIVTQIVLGTVAGGLGFVLATPLAAVAMVLSRFYREDVLGERGVVEEGS
jgi:predicted PurR-regulated permease PerM